MGNLRFEVRVDGLCKAFPGRTGPIPVIDSLSFSVRHGTWTTFLGPSGCGKTTLLRLLAGLIEPDAGSVRVIDASMHLPNMAAYFPQHDTLLPWRTALGNAVLASEIEGRPLAHARSEARELLEHFGLAGFESHYPSQLSGGMRQRLALIRTFLAHRDVLLLDEPLGALDPLTRTILQDWLLEIWGELHKTIVLVTHDVEEALVLSDRILVLSPRPATVERDVVVRLPRPRDRASVSFAERKGSILDLLLGAP